MARVNLSVVVSSAAERAQELQAMAEVADAVQPGLGEDLSALALISLGSTGFWAAGKDAGRYLERGIALARWSGRAYLEFTGLAYQATLGHYESLKGFTEAVAAEVAAFGIGAIIVEPGASRTNYGLGGLRLSAHLAAYDNSPTAMVGINDADDVNLRLEALFILSITLGLRPGELRKLTWDHVDLNRGVVHVWRSASKSGDNALNWRFSKMTRKAGIGHWHAHEGRHTAVSIMSSNGVPIQEISDTVGHKSTHVTETVYCHVIVPAIRGGATVMDDVFGNDDPDENN